MTFRLTPRVSAAVALAFVFLFPSGAWATDADSDGFTSLQDCKDSNSAINPDAQELIGNQVDEDCDRADALYRRLIVTAFPSVTWPSVGTVTRSTGEIQLGVRGAAGSITGTFTTPLPRGKVHLVVDVNAITGSCTAKVTTVKGGSTSVTKTISAVGTYASGALAVQSAAGLVPARTLSSIEFKCTAGNSMTLDWMSLQNTDDVYPPSADMSVAWKDVEAPGGGLSTTVVRTEDGLTSYAASDLGGVAKWSAEGWTTINGEGASGLTSQADLAVWDVLPIDGALYALSGRLNESSAALAGALSRSYDDGDTWEHLGYSHDRKVTSDAVYQVGGYGRSSACPAGNKAHAGGKLLESEPSNTDLVYIANGDLEEVGLSLYDGAAAPPDELCDFPDGSETLPVGWVRAIARVEGATYGTPMLLVGYQGVSDSLWLCELPEDTGAVSLSCTGDTATCTEVADFTALGLQDVRDIEVDPVDPSRVYIADGGQSTVSSACVSTTGTIYSLWVDDTGAASVEDFLEVPNDFEQTNSGQYLTGLSVDPDGEYLIAFTPVTADKDYYYDRMQRIATVDALAGAATSDWVAVNTDNGDEGSRAANIINGSSDTSWLFNGGNGVADPYPARWAPGKGIDGIWLNVPDSDLDFMILGTEFSMWGVYGMDDSSPGWDPEADTNWWFGPGANLDDPRTFQEIVVNDIAADGEGNIWMPASDLGLLVLTNGAASAARDCIWDSVNAAGAEVSIGMDDSVWVAMADQASGAFPHQMGVFRTLDYGTNWEYQGAGQSGIRKSAQLDTYACKDANRPVEPFGGTSTGSTHGSVFNGGSSALSYATWGSPAHIAAINKNAAVAVFKSWGPVSGHSTDGKLALTLDGGETWFDVPFDGTGIDASYTCNSTDFFDTPKGISLVRPGVNTYAVDGADGGTSIDSGEWAIDLMIASKYKSDSGYTKNCSVARVHLSGNPTSPTYSWTWFPLDKDVLTSTCYVDEQNILGVVASPWSDEAWIFGGYSHFPYGVMGTYERSYGGACTLDITNPTTAATTLINPATHQYNIADIAPNPYVTDTLIVVPQIDVSAWFECSEYATLNTPPAMQCPDVPGPFLLERGSGTWSEVNFGELPPSLIGTAGAWTPLGTTGQTLLCATEGASAWQGVMSW